jgi:integrase
MTIEERKPGVFRVTVHDGHGRRIRRTVHGTKTDAKREKVRLQADVHSGRVGASARMTLRAWAESWLDWCAGYLRPATVYSYRRLLQRVILPELGHLPLDQLTGARISQFYAVLARRTTQRGTPRPLAGSAQRKYHVCLKTCLQEAVYRGHLPLNPADAARPPRAETPEARHYTAAELRALLAHLATGSPCLRALVLVCVTTGLRRAEALALTWADVDLDGGSVSVTKSATTYAGPGQQAQPPKTRAGARQVGLPADAAAALRAWQAQQQRERAAVDAQPDGWQAGDYIFTMPSGRWMRCDYATRWFGRVVAASGLPPITLHGLRHTYATLLISAGLDVKTAGAALGHAQASTTLNIYAHALRGANPAATAIITAALSLPIIAPTGANDPNSEPNP